jgi:FkbM family methyltransferase
MTNLLDKVIRRARRGPGGSRARVRHGWRAVESGPLAGLQFYLPSGAGAGWADRFLVGRYEPEMLAAVGELARQGGTLYDVGAHTGFYTCAWLRLGGTRVEAFEPAAYNRGILQATAQRNGMADRVRIHAVALGDKYGQGTLIASSADVGASSAAYVAELGKAELPPSSHAAVHGLNETSVPVRRLDDLYMKMGLPVPNVLKLDVEGAEAAVLAGSNRLLGEACPSVLCEVHNVEVGLEIAHRLAKMRYDLRILGKNGPHTACLWTPQS